MGDKPHYFEFGPPSPQKEVEKKKLRDGPPKPSKSSIDTDSDELRRWPKSSKSSIKLGTLLKHSPACLIRRRSPVSDASAPKKSPDADLPNGGDFDIALLEREEDFQYGWGGIRPKCLQWCRHPIVVLLVMCLCTITQSFGVNGAFPTAARHLQLRFDLTLFDLGLIRMMYDIGSFLMMFPIMYFGSKGSSRPIWIGGGLIAVGFASVLIALPQVFAEIRGGYDTRWSADEPYCFPSNITARRPEEPECDKTLSLYKYVFMAGYFLYGMGAAPVYPMGLTYLDENVSHEKSSIFTGILLTCNLGGAALGLLIGGLLTKIPGDVSRQSHYVTDPTSPDWYGAWWIGVLITAVLNWTAAIPVFGFPAQLPGGAKARVEDLRDKLARKGRYAEEFREAAVDASVIRSVLKSLRALLCHPVYMGLVIGLCSYFLIATIFVTFIPVYFHKVYNMPTYEVGWPAAVLVIVSIISTVAGFVLQNRLHLNLVGNIRLSFITVMCGFLFAGSLMIMCKQTPLAGMTGHYPRPGNATTMALVADCNKKCQCNVFENRFEPVCYNATRHWTLFNKCYAGCQNSRGQGRGASDCKCLPEFDPKTNKGGTVQWDVCKHACNYKLYAMLIGLSWFACSIYLRRNAVEQSILRCVPFGLRVLGLAVAEAFTKLLGQVPASPIYGVIMQKSCLVWEHRCGERSFCTWTDAWKLALYTTITAYAIQFIGACGIGLALYGSRRSMMQSSTSTYMASKESTGKSSSRSKSASKSLSTESRESGKQRVKSKSRSGKSDLKLYTAMEL